MPFNIGGGELVFILVIVLIVFGAGRLPEVFGQLGKGVRTFREESSKAEASAISSPVSGSRTGSCSACGASLSEGAKFCAQCGKAVAG
jgi:sec-independent protein translocase protein TatA